MWVMNTSGVLSVLFPYESFIFAIFFHLTCRRLLVSYGTHSIGFRLVFRSPDQWRAVTALEVAAENGHVDCVRLLVRDSVNSHHWHKVRTVLLDFEGLALIA